MSDLGGAFIRAIGKPNIQVPVGIGFANPADQQVWEQIHQEIGAGWYMNRFLYLFGQGLDRLGSCLEAWSFLVKPGKERMIIGRNAYGALLVAEEPTKQGFTCPMYVLDPLNVRYWTHPSLVFINLLGYWLPENKLPDFLDHSLYDAWAQVTGDVLELNEILAMKEPKPLGGNMVASNFQIEDLEAYYRSTGPIYANALKDIE